MSKPFPVETNKTNRPTVMLPNRATSCHFDPFTGICQLKQPRSEASSLSARKRRTRCQTLRCNDRPPTALLPHYHGPRNSSSRTPSPGRCSCHKNYLGKRHRWHQRRLAPPPHCPRIYGRGATHCCRTLLALRPKSIMAIVRCNLFAAPGRLHSSWHLSLHLPLRIIAAASSRSLAAAIAYECLRTFSYWSLVYGFVDCG